MTRINYLSLTVSSMDELMETLKKLPKDLERLDISVNYEGVKAAPPCEDTTPDPAQVEPEPEPTPEPPVVTYKVLVIGRSVNVRDSDSKAGKVMFTAHKGNRFNLIDISSDTGWYHIETHKGPGYISNRADLTCLITVS